MKYFTSCVASLLFTFAANAADVGTKAPDFILDSLANVAGGKSISLADYKGKVVYVDFWASWCGPCQRSFPALEAIRAKYKAKGFEVIAINLDENAKDANDFLAKYPVGFPVAHDSTGKSAEQYAVKGMPSAYIIDRKGMVNHIVIGFDEKTEAATIESIVVQLTGSKP